MKTFAIIDNYSSGHESARIDTQGNDINFYDIPDSAVIRKGKPFFVPEFADKFVAAPTLAVRIDRLGKTISERFSHRYYGWVAPALAVCAPELLASLRRRGLPWSRAVVFDRSLMLGDFIPVDEFMSNGGVVDFASDRSSVQWKLESLNVGIESLISVLSRQNTVKTGDIILAALSPETIELIIGDHISASVGDKRLLEHKIR